jgi:hypothetical protein
MAIAEECGTMANEHAGVRNPSPPCQAYPTGIPGFVLAFVCPHENALSFQPWPRRTTYRVQWPAASRSRTGPTVLRSRTDTGNFGVPWGRGGGFHRSTEVLCSGSKIIPVVKRGSTRTAVHRIEARSPVRTTIYDLPHLSPLCSTFDLQSTYSRCIYPDSRKQSHLEH